MKSNVAICALLAVLTFAVFAGVFRCDFVHYDDPVFVTENPKVLGGFTKDGIKWAFTASKPDYWRPLSWLSHQLDVELFGLKAAGHHFTNLLFHTASTLLLFLALRLMTGAAWPSALVAALFAVHPLHVESVAWVAERKDVLNGFFWMLALLAYAHYARGPNVGRYLLVLLAFGLSLMSKPMAVTLPCVLLLLDYWPLKRVSWDRRTLVRLFAEKAPLFILAVVVSVLALQGQKEVGVITSTEVLPWSARVGNALVSYFQYLRKTIWPIDLAVFYPHPGRWPTAHVALAVGFLVIVSALVARNWQRQPFLVTGWLWFLGTLVPAIGLVQVGAQAMADRYTYIPLIGAFIMLAWTAQEVAALRATWMKPVGVIALTAVLASGFVANRQVRHWQNTYTLFEHALRVAPESALARMQFGETLNRLGRFEEAEQQLARAVDLAPQWRLARYNYAITLLNRGRRAAAIEQLTEAVRLKPDFAAARFELATVLLEAGQHAESAQHFREGLRVQPNAVPALNNLAWVMATHADDRLRNGAEAVALAERACALTRWETPAFIGTLAAAYAEAGRFNDAIAAAEKAKALAESKGDAGLASKNASLLELYRAGRPYRDAPGATQQP